MTDRVYCPDPRRLGRVRPVPVVGFAKGEAWALADINLALPFPMTLAEAQACAYCRTRGEQSAKLERLRNPPPRRRSSANARALLGALSMLGRRP